MLLVFGGKLIAQRNQNTNSNKIKKRKSFFNAAIDSSYIKSNNDSIITNKVESAPNNLEAKLDNIFDQNSPSHNLALIGAAINYGTSPTTSNNLENGFGFSFKLGYNFLNKLQSPFALYAGLGFDYLYFGGKRINKPNDVSLSINSNAYGWYPFIDFDIGKNWPLTFFGTAYWGGRIFYTRQNINYLDANNAKQTDTKNIEGDGTNIYGYGGGIKLKITDGIRLELRYQKNFGNTAKVVDPTSIEFDVNGNLKSYRIVGTDTDLDILFLGLVIHIPGN